MLRILQLKPIENQNTAELDKEWGRGNVINFVAAPLHRANAGMMYDDVMWACNNIDRGAFIFAYLSDYSSIQNVELFPALIA